MTTPDELRESIRARYKPDFEFTTVTDVPFTPLAETRVALISTAGLHLDDQPPFDRETPSGDCSFRRIRAGDELSRVRVWWDGEHQQPANQRPQLRLSAGAAAGMRDRQRGRDALQLQRCDPRSASAPRIDRSAGGRGTARRPSRRRPHRPFLTALCAVGRTAAIGGRTKRHGRRRPDLPPGADGARRHAPRAFRPLPLRRSLRQPAQPLAANARAPRSADAARRSHDAPNDPPERVPLATDAAGRAGPPEAPQWSL